MILSIKLITAKGSFFNFFLKNLFFYAEAKSGLNLLTPESLIGKEELRQGS